MSHISNTLGLSFELKRIGPLAALVAALVYLLALFLFVVSNTTEILSASFYSELLIQITCQHLLLLVGFDTLIYRKYYDTPPILVGHHPSPINTSSRENPKYLIIIPRKVLSPPSSSTLDREGSGALPGTLRERRSSPEGSASPCLPPE